MPDLDFAVGGVEAVPYAMTPTLALKLNITNQGAEKIHAVMLECQVRIEAQRRRYNESEKERLVDIFGEPDRWAQTLRSLLWTHSACNVPAFEDRVEIDLLVACTYDFNVLAGKYFYALNDGEIPLTLLFSGTIFFEGEGGALQVGRISWSKEARYQLPVSVWKQLIEIYYPNTAFLALRQDVFDRLFDFKAKRGLPTWEEALTTLLPTDEIPA
jgi:hypothetical protein